MTEAQIKDVRDFLYKEFYIKNDNYEIYTDYRDDINEDNVEKYLKEDFPIDAFYEDIYSWEQDSWDYISPDVTQKLIEHFPDIDEYDLSDWVDENISYSFDKDLGKSMIWVEFSLDVGNRNYDFSCDNILNYASGYGYSTDNSSMLWLAKKLRIKTDLLKAISYEEGMLSKYEYKNPLVKNIIDEFKNNTSNLSTVTFCCQMTVIDFFHLREATSYKALKELRKDFDCYHPLKTPTGKTITIPKGTSFGLWDWCQGGGSFTESLRLPKDIKIPLEVITHLVTSSHSYSVCNSCGMSYEVYDTEMTADIQ